MIRLILNYIKEVYTLCGIFVGRIKQNRKKKAYRHRKFGNSFQSAEYSFIDLLDEPVGLWTNLLVEEEHRNSLNQGNVTKSMRMCLARYLGQFQSKIQQREYIIDLPDFDNKGGWSKKYAKRLTELNLQKKKLKKLKIFQIIFKKWGRNLTIIL